jgi:hypothetical protein
MTDNAPDGCVGKSRFVVERRHIAATGVAGRLFFVFGLSPDFPMLHRSPRRMAYLMWHEVAQLLGITNDENSVHALLDDFERERVVNLTLRAHDASGSAVDIHEPTFHLFAEARPDSEQEPTHVIGATNGSV